ncbi:MAG: dTDP-4-amino-4,6-dideoxygalactose transaminase [Salibacteraceae bacterium]|jgi:dTDP-4-amino-4,6-dideoxygalactose transaminase
MNIPFYQTFTSEQSAENIKFLVDNPSRISEKKYTKLCQEYFENVYPDYKALMVGSCTRALDLIAIALDLESTDEVIMPSYNYVGVSNAFANKAKIVFADVDPLTLNINVESAEACLSEKSKVLVVMNYGGMSGDLEELKSFGKKHDLLLVEDNAQGLGAFFKDKRLGGFGDLSCISFDSLKNISCGEGGVVLYKPKFEERILTVFHNGTNRLAFENKQVPAYEWVGLGSKFALSEYSASILRPLLVNEMEITEERRERWQFLFNSLNCIKALSPYLPHAMNKAKHNAHIFYIIFDSKAQRDFVMNGLNKAGISCSFHYTPLHSSIYGVNQNFEMNMDIYTTAKSDCLLRLPMFNDLSNEQIIKISNTLQSIFESYKVNVLDV